MLEIPLNHKTIFLFDHSKHFSVPCGHSFEFDVISKMKSQSSNNFNSQQLKALDKTIWTCLIECAIEFSRIVYDIFPENKLISMMVSKLENPLNGWNDIEQNLDHMMNIMGTVMPPLVSVTKEEEEHKNLYKSLNTAVNAISQVSQLQTKLIEIYNNNTSVIHNTGRIILFSPTSHRNLEQIQEILNNSIIECNKRIDRNNNLNLLKIQKCELVIIDVVNCSQENQISESFQINSEFLNTRIFTSKAGRFLPIKMLQLVQKFFGLSVTSITNIPMKEELNANSSANYDVEILHEKSIHNQLKVCGILKNCISQKEGLDIVCLKWSNPKTSITEFNFSSCSYRITPTDVNSRPAACLTTFLLSGRCVVLEAKSINSSNRIASHVLCNHGNEIFMHCLSFNGKSQLDDRSNLSDNVAETKCRINDFNDLMKLNKLCFTNSQINTEENKEKPFSKTLSKIERMTRKWPLFSYESIVTNIVNLKPLINIICEENINPIEYNECIKCIEDLQNSETKNEVNNYKALWNELENWVKPYESMSERHKTLYEFINKLKQKSVTSNEHSLDNKNVTIKRNFDQHMMSINKKELLEKNNYDNEKIIKKQKIEIIPYNQISLFDLWISNNKKVSKPHIEFYGRLVNPSCSTTNLYTHLKIDENNLKPFSAKMDV